MEHPLDFTTLSPLPYLEGMPPKNDEGALIGPLTFSEAVSVFWKLKQINAQLNLSYFGIIVTPSEPIPYIQADSASVSFSTNNLNYILNSFPVWRICSRFGIYALATGKNVSIPLTINGPYYSRGDEEKFEDGKFYYTIETSKVLDATYGIMVSQKSPADVGIYHITENKIVDMFSSSFRAYVVMDGSFVRYAVEHSCFFEVQEDYYQVPAQNVEF